MGRMPSTDTKEVCDSLDYQTLESRGSQWAITISEKQLVRKIDLRILPILCSVYFFQFMDKIILNYANVMGFQAELHMTGNEFSWAGTAFFLGYMAAEFPQGALLQRFPVNRILALNICLWGVVTACTCTVKTSQQLLAVRTLLGVFESAVTPSLILLTSAWYKREAGAARFGVWFCGLGIGQILGGVVSYGFQRTSPQSTILEGWRLMFLVIGLANTITSVFVFLLPPTPAEAEFLSSSEKEFIQQIIKEDHSGTGAKVLRARSIWETILDLQTWLLCLVTMLTSMSAGVIVYFSATIIKSFGYNSQEAALLNIPSGVVSIVATLTVTFIVANGHPRWIGMAVASAVAALGACLMSFAPAKNKAALLSGVYLVNAAPSVLTLVLSSVAANYRGYTRKIAGGAIIAGSFSFANIITPQTFQAKDAPGYMPAKITLVACLGAAVFFSCSLRILYFYRNRRADRFNQPAMSHFERNAVRFAGASLDFADRSYRYAL